MYHFLQQNENNDDNDKKIMKIMKNNGIYENNKLIE